MGGRLTRLLIIGPFSQHPASEVTLHPLKSPRFGAARQGTGPRLPPRRRVPTSSQQLERLAVAETQPIPNGMKYSATAYAQSRASWDSFFVMKWSPR